ncbi:MAG: hypothetical protein FJZ78_12010 [Bacteroidetes bacterium]|nr:hypothetical protein [Bacteroidota bacterium]
MAFITSSSFAQKPEQALFSADSLFAAKNYSAALKQYQTLEANGFHSPAMLLKMAYIAEGTSNTTDALFALYKYHQITNDKAAYQKALELADQAGLSGYQTPEVEYVLNQVGRFAAIATSILMGFAILLLALLFNRSKSASIHLSDPITLAVLTLTLTIALLTNLPTNQKAIVTSPNAAVLSAPSSAANRIDFLKQGDLIRLTGDHDIWSSFSLQNKKAFIRTLDLRPL